MLQNDDYYMDMALTEARQAFALGEVPVGAIIVDPKGRIVAAGHNRRETWRDATAHAEIVAIRAACAKLNAWRLPDLTLYVTLEPCPMCAGAIVMARLKRVVYGIYDSKTGAVDSLFNLVNTPLLNHQVEITAGIRADECAELLKKFFMVKRAE